MDTAQHVRGARHRQAAPGAAARLPLRLAGAGLLFATAGIHLDLYLTGYRTIPTIGGLFLFQIIVAFVLGAAVLVSRSRLVAAAGAGFALATLGGYLITVQWGLFGFREVRTTAGIVAGVIEVLAFAVLAAVALWPAGSGSPAGGRDRLSLLLGRVPRGVAVAGVAGVSVVALGLTGGALAASGSASPGPGSGSSYSASGPASTSGGLRTATIGGQTVLVNAAGRTLYTFAPDGPGKSVCYGSCAVYWPPVPGHLTAGAGVTGKLGTITRTGGGTQETYNGHPLYTYVGDTGPGQAHGNNLNLNGGLWKVVPAG